jgi:hypothetical protein
MAAKLTKHVPEHMRERIKTALIINRLQDYVFLDPDDPLFHKKQMSQMQVSAAMALLKKTMPDLSTTEIKGEVQKTYVVRAPVAGDDWEEWKRNFQPTTIDQDGKSLN